MLPSLLVQKPDDSGESLEHSGLTNRGEMMTAVRRLLGLAIGLLGVGASAEPLTATTAEGITIHGEPYLGDLSPDSPLVVLFHMGGSSARGEYAQIAAWLNEAGYRAVAWDLRGGGDRLGVANRTVEAPDTPALESYCHAYPEIAAAVDHAITTGLARSARPVVIA